MTGQTLPRELLLRLLSAYLVELLLGLIRACPTDLLWLGCGWVLEQGVVVLALERPEVSGLSVTRTDAMKNRWEMLRKTSRDMLIEE